MKSNITLETFEGIVIEQLKEREAVIQKSLKLLESLVQSTVSLKSHARMG